ncbi:MAG TPA: host-nuclease inhibitor Gam family protein [Candidatus Moranbacteria bacterium]|nr:host-nuclease inhibitor Gam family protein [Candidatus Moranbacteria bacterium]HSA08586.1 host-nuclease inhibitor Gam family protein [Candidatus Moranbacteria bacterium]
MKKETVKKKVASVPKDRPELEQFAAQVREAEQKIRSIGEEASKKIKRHEDEINEIKKDAQGKAKPLEEEIDRLAAGIFIFAQGHREELTENEKKKTVEFMAGDKIRWYFPPPSVIVEDEEAAIAELKRQGLLDFIRTKEAVDKTEILKDPDKIKKLKNLSIDQAEIFAIIPAEMGIELQKGKRKFKKVPL